MDYELRNTLICAGHAGPLLGQRGPQVQFCIGGPTLHAAAGVGGRRRNSLANYRRECRMQQRQIPVVESDTLTAWPPDRVLSLPQWATFANAERLIACGDGPRITRQSEGFAA